MFSNFSSSDFAKVLLVEELSGSSLSEIIRGLMKEGAPVEDVSEMIDIQRRILGLKAKWYKGYEEILEDDLVVNMKKYYMKCEELKIVLVLYLVEFRNSRQSGGKVDMFNVYRLLGGLKKFSERARGSAYIFGDYKDFIRDRME